MGNLQNIVTALYRELETIPFVHKGSLLFVWEQVV